MAKNGCFLFQCAMCQILFGSFIHSSDREHFEHAIRCCFVNSRHTTKYIDGGSLVFNERLHTQIVLRLLNGAINECKSLNVYVCVCFLSDPVSLFA